MKKTTLYLPDDMLLALKETATLRGCSEASIVRSALERELEAHLKPSPIDFGMLSRDFGPIDFDSSDLDSALDGFGLE